MERIAGFNHKLDEAISTMAVLNLIANSKMLRSDLRSEFNLILEKWAYKSIKALVLGSFNLGLVG